MLGINQQFIWENNLSFRSFEVVKLNDWLLRARDDGGLLLPWRPLVPLQRQNNWARVPWRWHLWPLFFPWRRSPRTHYLFNHPVQHLTAIPVLEELHLLPGNQLRSLPADLLKGDIHFWPHRWMCVCVYRSTGSKC